MTTKIIDVNALVSAPALVLKVNGVKHPLVISSIKTFLANYEDIKAMPLNATQEDEAKLAVKLIGRAFPSLTEDQILEFNFEQLQKIQEIVQGASGELVSTDEAAVEGNGLADPT